MLRFTRVAVGSATVLSLTAALSFAGSPPNVERPGEAPSSALTSSSSVLKLAALDVSSFEPLARPGSTAGSLDPSTTRWRTTFGAERKPAPTPSEMAWSQANGVSDADVVLVHGIGNAQALRRVFQPREWRLVISRTGITSPNVSATSFVPMTAVAVRANREFKVRAINYFLSSLKPGKLATRPTAVKLQIGTTSLWLVSTIQCPAAGEACEARDSIEAWKGNLTKGDANVVGGPLKSGDRNDASSPCAHLDFEASAGLPSTSPVTRRAIDMGCIAVTDVKL